MHSKSKPDQYALFTYRPSPLHSDPPLVKDWTIRKQQYSAILTWSHYLILTKRGHHFDVRHMPPLTGVKFIISQSRRNLPAIMSFTNLRNNIIMSSIRRKISAGFDICRLPRKVPHSGCRTFPHSEIQLQGRWSSCMWGTARKKGGSSNWCIGWRYRQERDNSAFRIEIRDGCTLWISHTSNKSCCSHCIVIIAAENDIGETVAIQWLWNRLDRDNTNTTGLKIRFSVRWTVESCQNVTIVSNYDAEPNHHGSDNLRASFSANSIIPTCPMTSDDTILQL